MITIFLILINIATSKQDIKDIVDSNDQNQTNDFFGANLLDFSPCDNVTNFTESDMIHGFGSTACSYDLTFTTEYLYIKNCQFYITKCTFKSIYNKGGNGGAILVATDWEVTPSEFAQIEECSFLDCYAQIGGGAICAESNSNGYKMNIIKSNFINNSATGSKLFSGSALYLQHVFGSIKQCTFINNRGILEGYEIVFYYGVYSVNLTLEFEQNTIEQTCFYEDTDVKSLFQVRNKGLGLVSFKYNIITVFNQPKGFKLFTTTFGDGNLEYYDFLHNCLISDGTFIPADNLEINASVECKWVDEMTSPSQTEDFSSSSFFTNSSPFSESKYFSKSSNFLPTDKFSETNKFTQSLAFSKSDKFASTSFFSSSSKFSETNKFSRTQFFTGSKAFTSTFQFSATSIFTTSNKFSKTSEFSHSFFFSSEKFSCSKALTITEPTHTINSIPEFNDNSETQENAETQENTEIQENTGTQENTEIQENTGTQENT